MAPPPADGRRVDRADGDTGDAGLLAALRRAVGEDHVLVGEAATGYERDWTGRFSGTARAVVRPADATQVQQVVGACAQHGAAIVPQGGNTGLVGGGVPRDGEVVLSTRRLDDIGTVDPTAATVTVGAGAVLADVNRAAAAHGLVVGVDLASRGSATIGGMVATNAGGVHVVAHGTMRQQVLGVEAVLADGTLLRRMGGLPKDNAGYDLTQWLVGSEGTLAILTAVILRLVVPPRDPTTAVVAVPDLGTAIMLLRDAERAGRLHAVEYMSRPGVDLVAGHLERTPPVELQSGGGMLLVEWTGPVHLDGLVDSGWPAHHMSLAQDPADRRALWDWRERHTEAISAAGTPVKLDLSLPLGRAAEFAAAVVRRCPTPPIMFGHLAEGTLHVNLLGLVGDGAQDPAGPQALEAEVLQICADHGGSIAAEHGVGIAKAPWLHLSRTEAEIDVMRRIKHALDPTALLNPGVILPAPRRRPG